MGGEVEHGSVNQSLELHVDEICGQELREGWQEVKDSENWGSHKGRGCEESCKMGMEGELNFLYTVPLGSELLWRVSVEEDLGRPDRGTVLVGWPE